MNSTNKSYLDVLATGCLGMMIPFTEENPDSAYFGVLTAKQWKSVQHLPIQTAIDTVILIAYGKDEDMVVYGNTDDLPLNISPVSREMISLSRSGKLVGALSVEHQSLAITCHPFEVYLLYNGLTNYSNWYSKLEFRPTMDIIDTVIPDNLYRNFLKFCNDHFDKINASAVIESYYGVCKIFNPNSNS